MDGTGRRSVRTGATGQVIALLTLLVAAGVGCSDFDGWDYSRFPGAIAEDAVATPDTGGTEDTGPPPVSRACNQCLESMVGKAMRFETLIVKEPIVPNAPRPDALPEFLNGIWQEDVRRYILNIALRIDSVDLTTGQMDLVGGAGWHDLGFDDLPLEPDGEVTQTPTEYHFLPGATGAFTIQLDEECRFVAIEPTALGFHPGPDDNPTICSPDPALVLDTVSPNAIPILDLDPSGAITEDCQGVVEGHLTGCIPKSAAARICSWGPAPDYRSYQLEGDPSATPVEGDASYCKHWCGSGWVNFGGFVSLINVPLSCDSDGDGTDDGYRIAGDFTATLVDFAPAE